MPDRRPHRCRVARAIAAFAVALAPACCAASASDAPRLGIHLSRDDDRWIPELNAVTTVTARIYRWDPGREEWVFPGEPRVITFGFLQRSREKGVCMNAFYMESPDLFFARMRGWNEDFECLEDETGKGHFNAVRSKTAAVSQTAAVFCDDYGAYGRLTAVAPGCVPLRRGPDGKLVVAATGPEASCGIPADDNGNRIADAYEEACGLHPRAGDDLDAFPQGGSPGDGLTAYDEYRGFMTGLEHVRTSWLLKDLFILDRDHLGLGWFPERVGEDVHRINAFECELDGTVNFNRAPGARAVRCRVVVDEPAGGGLLMSPAGPDVPRLGVDRDKHSGAEPAGDTVARGLRRGAGPGQGGAR